MTTDGLHTISKMALLTVTGWAVSLSDVIEVAKLFSFVVPTALSVVVFVRDHKKRKNEDQ